MNRHVRQVAHRVEQDAVGDRMQRMRVCVEQEDHTAIIAAGRAPSAATSVLLAAGNPIHCSSSGGKRDLRKELARLRRVRLDQVPVPTKEVALERAKGVEPSSSAWEAEVMAVIRRPRLTGRILGQ